jgi:thiamine-monophosphate kinase
MKEEKQKPNLSTLSLFSASSFILHPSSFPLMTIANYGEDRLVADLLALLPPPGRRVLTPPGDDCAVVRGVCNGRRQLLKTDCLIEGIHFTPDTPPEQIGWKALCRPLSDIAAMGGQPAFALVTLALANKTELARAHGIYEGIGRAAREFGVEVVGGETARSPGPCFLSVCLTGETDRRGRALRSGGRPGDRLYVTGRLGGSFASGRHLSFRPRLEEGRWLAKHFPIRAMMDLSDGLGADLPRLARASGTGFALDRSALPLAAGCTTDAALGDGEDYELLFAIGPRRAGGVERAWRKKFPNEELTAIGELTLPGEGQTLAPGGFDHFVCAGSDHGPKA